MGRTASSGRRPLSHPEVALLKSLREECLQVRTALTLDDKPDRSFVSLKHWVQSRAIPLFNNKFHTADAEEGEKIYQWYKNHCKVSTSTPPAPSAHQVPPPEDQPATPPPRKLPSLRGLVYKDFSEEICAVARRAADESSSPDSFILEWNKALTAKVKSLSAEEHQKYDDIITAETIKWESSPSKDEILSSQHMLREEITMAIRNILGWERKQYGDAMCFLTITYRNRDDEVIEDRFMVSNEEKFLAHYKPFIVRYDECMGGLFASIGEQALPKHGLNIMPKTSFIKELAFGTQIFSPPNPEKLTPIELRQLLKTFIEELWVNSEVGRTAATLPWRLLQQAKPSTESPLQDSSIFSSFPNLNPEQLEFGDLFKLAAVLSNAGHGVTFKKSTLQVSSTCSTPPTPPQPSIPPMSPASASPEPPLPPLHQLSSTSLTSPGTLSHTASQRHLSPRPQSPLNITPVPQQESNVDKPPCSFRNCPDHQLVSVQPRLSTPTPVPAEPEPPAPPQLPTDVAPITTNKKQKGGKKQQNNPQISRPNRASSRNPKPPSTVPKDTTGKRKTRVCERYTYEPINSSPEPAVQTVDTTMPSTRGGRPHKKPRMK